LALFATLLVALIAGAAILRIRTPDPSVDVGIASPVQALSEAPFSRDPGPVSYPDEVEIVTSFRAVDGALVDPVPDPVYARAWARIESVVPPVWLDRVVQFTVMSEGPANIVAIVHRSSQIPDTWVLSIDADDLDEPDLLEGTLIHELGHMVSLGSKDFAFTTDECSDPIYAISMDLGCARVGSMIARWNEQFWTDEDPQFDTGTFVSRYSTSSPHEDLAETFMAWVLHPAPIEGSIVDAKHAFLDADPEARALRNEIVEFAGTTIP
jgi:hypothetical protein